MGQSQSKNRGLFLSVLSHTLESRGDKTPEKSLAAFYDFVLSVNQWFPEEGSLPLEDIIARLKEALGRAFPPSEDLDTFLKQLAWENVHTLCQELIRPIRKTGTVQDYIKACIDASPAVVQGKAYAAVIQGQHISAYFQNLKEEETKCFMLFLRPTMTYEPRF